VQHPAEGNEQLIETQKNPSSKPFAILELYSSLPLTDQNKIFEPLPEGTRKYIIATNIAETSITIPKIRYVIDSGQEKHRYFDKVWKWKKGWASKAMAEQRSGRAGRTAHGYCYRLYSAALYANIMENYSAP
jgi:ATP-dependent RNA helicase DHX37/DHR1